MFFDRLTIRAFRSAVLNPRLFFLFLGAPVSRMGQLVQFCPRLVHRPGQLRQVDLNFPQLRRHMGGGGLSKEDISVTYWARNSSTVRRSLAVVDASSSAARLWASHSMSPTRSRNWA